MQGVKEYSYATPPMRAVLEEEQVVGETLLGRVLDMSMTGPVYKSNRQRKEEAKKRLMEREQVRESDREYYQHMIQQYQRSEERSGGQVLSSRSYLETFDLKDERNFILAQSGK